MARPQPIIDAERSWLGWLETAEDMIGRSLDGDHLDVAHDRFADGATAVEYALEVNAQGAA